MKDPVKIGIVIDQPVVPIWIYRMIKKLIECDFAEIIIIAFSEKTTKTKQTSPFFYRLHEKFELLMLRDRLSFTKTKSITEIVNHVPTITLSSNLRDGFDTISSYKPDIVINLSPIEINHSLSKSARYGIWSCAIENQGINEINSNVYWKVAKKSPTTTAIIYCSNNYTSKSAIHTSWIATNFKSTLINLDIALDLFSQIIPKLIHQTHLLDYIYISNKIEKYNKLNNDTEISSKQLPSNRQAFRNLIIAIYRLVSDRIAGLKKWRWFLMFSSHSTPFPKDVQTFTPLTPPKGCFWADPFVIVQNDKKYLFIEEFPYIKNKGHISLLELDHYYKIKNIETIIEQPYHMSYPFVFECDNQFYMIPETSANRTIELYQCDEFPRKWHRKMNLMENIKAKDSTLFFYNKKWWLFTAINESSTLSDHVELYLFFADDFTTVNWQPHPQNPIVTDIRTSRPAGRIFTQGDRIYRPSQDCSVRYGRALNILEIKTLNETAYEEILISKTEADWSPELKGIHTFNTDRNFAVVDTYKF